MPEPFAVFEPRRTSVPVLTHVVDGYLTEEHERSVSVTRFPLESGSELTDHAVREPDVLKLTGWTSDLHPTDAANIPDVDRPAQAWAEVDRIMDERSLLRVTTVLAVYDDMVLTRAVAPVSSRTGRGLFFTFEFTHVVTAPLRRVEFVLPAPAPAGPAADRVVATDPDSEFTTGGEPAEVYSPPVEEMFDDGGGLLLGIPQVIVDTLGNVIGAFSMGDIGGGFSALGTGAREIVDRVGNKVEEIREGPSDESGTPLI